MKNILLKPHPTKQVIQLNHHQFPNRRVAEVVLSPFLKLFERANKLKTIKIFFLSHWLDVTNATSRKYETVILAKDVLVAIADGGPAYGLRPPAAGFLHAAVNGNCCLYVASTGAHPLRAADRRLNDITVSVINSLGSCYSDCRTCNWCRMLAACQCSSTGVTHCELE